MRNNLVKSEIISYKDGYMTQGILGLSIPILCIITCGVDIILKSISESYYLGNRDFFVAIMFSLGISFIANVGIDKIEFCSNKIIGVCSCLIPLIPCNSSLGNVHYCLAIVFFCGLAFNCWYNYHLKENYLFLLCSVLIFFSILFIGATKLIFIGETLGLTSFSIAYFKEGFFNYLKTRKHGKSIKKS